MAPRKARPSKAGTKVTCPCCNKDVHPDTRSKHLRGAVPVLYQASQQANNEDGSGWSIFADARPVKRFRAGQKGAVEHQTSEETRRTQEQGPSTSNEMHYGT